MAMQLQQLLNIKTSESERPKVYPTQTNDWLLKGKAIAVHMESFLLLI